MSRPVAEIRTQQAKLRKLAGGYRLPGSGSRLPAVRRPSGARDCRSHHSAGLSGGSVQQATAALAADCPATVNAALADCHLIARVF
jgi:hypothetical protein